MATRPKFLRTVDTGASWITKARYAPNTRTLEVCTENGNRYRYYRVPRTKVDALFQDRASLGQRYNRLIKGRYQSRDLTSVGR